MPAAARGPLARGEALLGPALKALSVGLFGLTVWGDFDAAVKLARDAGFKTAVISAEESHLDALEAAGMKGLVALWLDPETAKDEKKWDAFVARVTRDVRRLRGHKALGAWYLADEPDGERIAPERFKKLADLVRTLDPKTPRMAVFNKPGRWAPYMASVEIAAVDPYLRRKDDGTYDDVGIVKRWVSKASDDAAAAGPGKKVWAVLGVFEERPKREGAVPYYRKPTPAELLGMAKDARDAGASALLLYSFCFTEGTDSEGWRLPEDDPALWDAAKSLAGGKE